jgi:polysaccharide export outer membrane protein
MRRTSIFLLALLAVAVASCASKRPSGEAEGPARFTESEAEYRIGVDDRLLINVWKNPELSLTVPVRPDGMVTMPLIGDIKAGGLTATEVAESIKKRLASYIREPSVAVIVTELRSHEFISRVRVTGAVRVPRSLPFRQGMTVLDAVLEAGGVNEFAAPNRSKLYRKKNGGAGTEVYDVELSDILNKGRLGTNYVLYPGDVVTIPERLF